MGNEIREILRSQEGSGVCDPCAEEAPAVPDIPLPFAGQPLEGGSLKSAILRQLQVTPPSALMPEEWGGEPSATWQDAIARAILLKALKGDVAAVKYLASLQEPPAAPAEKADRCFEDIGSAFVITVAGESDI